MRESSNSASNDSPWLGKLRFDSRKSNASQKGKGKVDQPLMPNVLARHSYVDGESSGSEKSLDEELGIPFVVTLGAQRARVSFKTLGTDLGVHRSTSKIPYLQVDL